MRGLACFAALAFAVVAAAAADEERGKCRTVKETMLTCLEANEADLPPGKRDAITWLVLVRSVFPTMKRDVMKRYPALTDLHATNAGIETVEEDTFRDQPDLNWVDLSFNKITHLDADLFANAKTFYYLNVSGNAGLILPKNSAFLNSAKLNWLDLSSCGLSQLYPETFTKLRGLKVLSLAGNKLETLPETVFKPLQNLYSLDLSKNQFRSVAPATFSGMRHISIYLSGNPWECDCSLYPFIEWAKTRRMKDEVRCSKPDNKLWKDVSGMTGCDTASVVEVF